MTSKYDRGVHLGSGTWGDVYESFRKSDGLKVAIKRIKPGTDRTGMNFTALREIKYMKELRSINVIDLKDVFLSNGVLHLVLDFCPFDLEKIIQSKNILLSTHHVKSYMKMILNGMECLHNNYILHRDLKPANLLIGNDGQIKIADFGLARSHSSPENMTFEVVTRWYRAPELLFGARFYGAGIDVWAIGCIFAEIILRSPLFTSESDVQQLAKIFNVLGTPIPSDWPGVNTLPHYVEFEPREPMDLSKLFGKPKKPSEGLSSDLDLILKMLTLNPAKRITTKQSLEHRYFLEDPQPCDPADLPTPAGKSSIAKEQPSSQDEPVTKKMRY